MLSLISCSAQNVVLDIEFEIPKELPEASGIVVLQNHFWIINDSGNDSKLYKMDYAGLLVDSIYIKGGNVDWEDLTIDPSGNIYIADFGNNTNDRNDLVIFKVRYTDLGKDTVVPEEIHFNYGNQTSFPPQANQMNFDCEALIWYADHLLLFTKNRSESKQTKIYRISDMPGNYTTYPLDSIPTNGWITSASLSYNKKHLMLLSEDSLFVINNFSDQTFQGTSVDTITFDKSQKEAIYMDENGKVFISEEAEHGGSNYMFSLNLAQVLKTYIPQNTSVTVVRKTEYIELTNSTKEPITIQVYTYDGKLVDTIILRNRYKYKLNNSNPLIFRSEKFAVLK
jgi:hypothetical protein